jgi:ATP/maltotriose-dependent transcriptional regulator MalT
VHLDEAGAATLAGTIGPWVSGIAFCAIIWAYLDRGDLNRAGQWTDQFTRWVKRNSGFGAPGLCCLHRGEVLCGQGNLRAAESEIHRARELLAESARYAEGDACRVLGEIRLLRGDVDGAEEAFRQAHELGWHPLPGWALLQEARGQFTAAINSLQRGMETPTWADGQRRGILLAHLARIAARAGKRSLAKKTLAQLEPATELRSTAGCDAQFRLASAELACADGRHSDAVKFLRATVSLWLDEGSKINAAHTRLRLAQVLAQSGDPDAAELELSAARKAFSQMGAAPMTARCEEIRLELLSARLH